MVYLLKVGATYQAAEPENPMKPGLLERRTIINLKPGSITYCSDAGPLNSCVRTCSVRRFTIWAGRMLKP